MNWKVTMENTNWLKQTPNKPLFGDLLWSRPENRRNAGKLLIVGGNTHSVAAPGMAYSAAEKAGAGTIRVLLPQATKKVVGRVFPAAEFTPSTPSGSFSREALAQLLEGAEWADGVLLAGDFGRNSETAILLELFAAKYKGQLTASQDGLDYFLNKKSLLFERANSLAVINFGKLQKLAQNNRSQPPIKYSMNLRQLVEVLSEWTRETNISLVTTHAEQFVIAAENKISTTPMPEESNWQVELAAYASVWLMQQPNKPFEVLTTSIFDYLA
jgi:hypothetical protein